MWLATLTILGVLGATAAPATASGIMSSSVEAQSFNTEAALGPEWDKFLAGGPLYWAATPPPSFPSHLVLNYSNSAVVETPFVDYLTWRRALDPARFDLNHPITGPILGQPRPPVVPPAPQEGLPPVRVVPPVPQLGVPEPGTLTILLTFTVMAGWNYRSRLRRHQDGPGQPG